LNRVIPLESMIGMALGAPEAIIIVIFGILVFGADKIPKLARNVGRAKGEFQQGIMEVASTSTTEEDMDRGGMTEEVASERE